MKFSTENNSIKLKQALNGKQENSHLYISHRADSIERALSIIEESVNTHVVLEAA